MTKTIYVSFSEINELQTNVMICIQTWVHEKKTPIPLKEVITKMQANKVNKNNTIYSLKVLIEKGYIRRANIISNKTFFVQLKTI